MRLCLSRFAHYQMLKRIVFLHHQHVSTKCIYPGISGALVSTKAWALDTTRAWALVSTRAWAWALCPRKERPQPTTKRRTVIKLAESGSSLVLLPANFLNGQDTRYKMGTSSKTDELCRKHTWHIRLLIFWLISPACSHCDSVALSQLAAAPINGVTTGRG